MRAKELAAPRVPRGPCAPSEGPHTADPHHPGCTAPPGPGHRNSPSHHEGASSLPDPCQPDFTLPFSASLGALSLVPPDVPDCAGLRVRVLSAAHLVLPAQGRGLTGQRPGPRGGTPCSSAPGHQAAPFHLSAGAPVSLTHLLAPAASALSPAIPPHTAGPVTSP